MVEHSLVKLKETQGDIQKGTYGTIVHVYPSKNTFEVEFVVDGKSIIKPIGKKHLQKLNKKDLAKLKLNNMINDILEKYEMDAKAIITEFPQSDEAKALESLQGDIDSYKRQTKELLSQL